MATLDIRDSGYCKFYVNTGECYSGVNCRYMHPPQEELKNVRQEWVRQRVAQRYQKQQRTDDPHSPDSKFRKSCRAHVFAKWLLETFPEAMHFLDIAGGKGLVGILIEKEAKRQGRGGVHSTLIDPRPRQVSKQMRRVLDGCPGSELNRHIQQYFPCDESSELLTNTSNVVLVGLHPDEATEAIVDTGLRLGIPFAVVPCCIFKSLDTGGVRVLEGIGAVNSTERLIDWIKAKDPGICEVYLPFEGRNRVLFRKTE